MSLWTTWMLCVSRPSPPPRSVTLVHTRLQQVTSPRAGTPPPATALERYYPRDTLPWTLLITAGRQRMWSLCLSLIFCVFFFFLPQLVNMCCTRMVSGRRTCCVCERVLGSGAAMVVEALRLCYHLACFQVRGHDQVEVRSQ